MQVSIQLRTERKRSVNGEASQQEIFVLKKSLKFAKSQYGPNVISGKNGYGRIPTELSQAKI